MRETVFIAVVERDGECVRWDRSRRTMSFDEPCQRPTLKTACHEAGQLASQFIMIGRFVKCKMPA